MLQPCHCSYPVCFCVGFLHFLGSRLGQTCSLRHSQAKGSKGMRHACSGENEICVGLLHRSTGQSWTSCNFQNRREYQDPRPCTKTQTPKSEKKGAVFFSGKDQFGIRKLLSEFSDPEKRSKRQAKRMDTPLIPSHPIGCIWFNTPYVRCKFCRFDVHWPSLGVPKVRYNISANVWLPGLHKKCCSEMFRTPAI